MFIITIALIVLIVWVILNLAFVGFVIAVADSDLSFTTFALFSIPLWIIGTLFGIIKNSDKEE